MTKSGAVKVGAAEDAAAMTTNAYRICGKCGATILADAADAPCPACLLETGLGSSEEEGGSVTRVVTDFGDYELLGEIGRGGQGVVYRARQKSLNRIVALKVIALGSWATEAHLKRFRREAEMAASLDDPGIVPIYEFGERDGCCYFSMKIVEGDKLDELIAREPMSIQQAAQLVAKLARAVQHAHERGVLHRDIKPGNVLIDASGEPQLTDFGLARLVEAEQDMTRTSEMSGTPSYMAPEQAESKSPTPATDVYGLGAVLYQLITAQPPFTGNTSYETIRAVLETEPRRPRSLNAKVDIDLETICLKCLEKDPQRRYSSAAALGEDLESWSRHKPIRARRSGVVSCGRKFVRRNPAVAFLVPLLVAFAIALGVSLWKQEVVPPTGLAVLPFENLNDDKENASFADGIQDDILTKLAKIADLKVISRTSVMPYRGMHDSRKIARALGVSHVLEGSVRKSNDRIRLNAQLIDARSDQHVWAEQYDRDLTDVFAIQSEVAQKIVSALRTKISLAERSALDSKPTQDLEAYDLYVRAKALTGFSSPDNPAALEGLSGAVDLLEKAVERDPNFSLAYCLLTEANLILYWVPGRADATRRARAEAALRVAQRLAPDAGETHLASALFHHYGNRDYDRALEELEIAERSLPNNADVFRASGRIERRLGRWNEALRHFLKANELDPRDPTPLAHVAQTYLMLRHYGEAEQMADRGIAAFSEAPDEFWNLKGESALAQGDLKRARAAMESLSTTNSFPWFRFRVLFYERNYAEAERFSVAQWQHKDDNLARYFALWSAMVARANGDAPNMQSFLLAARRAYEPLLREEPVDPGVLSYLGMIDAALGRKEEALREGQKAVELRPISRDALEGPENSISLAVTYAWAGERARAIEQLASVVNVPNGVTFGALKLDPIWDELRADPRFAEIVAEAAKPIALQ